MTRHELFRGMLAVAETLQNGDNLECEPQPVELVPLDKGMERLRTLKLKALSATQISQYSY
jgi:hypothetical protein